MSQDWKEVLKSNVILRRIVDEAKYGCMPMEEFKERCTLYLSGEDVMDLIEREFIFDEGMKRIRQATTRLFRALRPSC